MSKTIHTAFKLAGFAALCIGAGSVSAQTVVSFSSPGDGDSVDAGDLLNVTVVATDADGRVENVRLFVDGNFVRQENVSAYEWGAGDSALQNLEAGTHQLTAIATDDDGNSTEESISITVAGDTPSVEAGNSAPVVSFSSPRDGDSIDGGSPLNVTVNASDSDGSVENVRLFVNRNFVRQENRVPYEWGQADSIMQNLEAGTHQLTAMATDNAGATTEETITITVSEDAPVISGPPVEDGCIQVSTLADLKSRLDDSDVCVQMSAGTYEFNRNNTGPGELFSDPSVLLFSGSNSTFIFDGVKFEFDTDILTAWGGEEVHEFHVIGRNNEFRNLTMEDIGDTAPSFRARSVLMDGADNLIEGFDMTVRGSFPYGYGDIFGKGGGSVIGHRKHSGVLIRGDRNHLKDCRLIMRSYGHGIFVQGGHDATIEGCYVEGELRTTDEVLAEEGTGSPADDVDFMTVWGFKLRPGYRFSLQEGGIRGYTTGGIYGTDDNRETRNLTVLDSTVKRMRTGVSIGWVSGDKYVENVTVLGTETGFWVGGDARVVNSRGDTSVGPLFSEDVGRSNSELELTILDDDITKIGDMPSVYLAGSRHDFTLKDGTTSANNSDIEILVGGTRNAHRWQENSGEEPLVRSASDLNIRNETNFPMILGTNSANNDIESCGPVDDNGNNNDVDDC